MKPEVTAFFDRDTFTVSYVVRAPSGDECVIIDSVLDFDQASGRTTTTSADELLTFIEQNRLQVAWILETHAHADHLSAAAYLKAKTGAKTATGSNFHQVQETFAKIFNLGEGFATNGGQFDRLLADGERLSIAGMTIETLHTPGHTPSCVTFVCGDAVFVGDTLFMPDYGTARADFPGGDAAALYRSIRRILELPAETRLFMCHDYKAPGRDEFRWETTVAEQRAHNIHIHDGVSEAEFVAFRQARDAQLGMPKLIIPSIQVNIRAGEMPEPEDNGTAYLKVPLNAL
jgi:glyoxylase-like metal-dependent hydrolase (beta-lactamase superfamily II)